MEDGGDGGGSRLGKVFANVEETKKATLITYLTAGYPRAEDTVDLMMAMEENGAGVIELGVPFTDPQADGTTIQRTNEVALKHGISLTNCLDYVKTARAKGLSVPVVLMGYLNPFLKYGEEKLMRDCKSSGVDGFIVVDLSIEESASFVQACEKEQLSFVPLLSPTTADDRLPAISKYASSFLYCVSITGVTGER